ncbi:hypothetical protein PHYPSEUDO_005748 [Phytophthora pseudosyringae]|uniref:Myb/SANT-like domain-containing protein n=1 Tax=Phytophthora pseudosyringae TaxID=221518 RepID=A0A8T1VKR7_9STRA|nr:hypothetical protein PHYPSEUDO_005748 [Phytophthora pseudosyringae]
MGNRHVHENLQSKERRSQHEREDTRVKKKPIFWGRDSVNEGKSSLQVVLDCLSTETNYNKWRSSDRNSGNTKEAVLKEIVAALKAEGVMHRTTGDVREKINTIEKEFWEAVDFQAQTGSGITNESTLRGEILKSCPYYYKLADVIESRTSVRPRVTSDDIDDEEEAVGRSSIITQRAERCPLALDEDDTDAKRQKKHPVEKLLDQQNRTSKRTRQKSRLVRRLHQSHRHRHSAVCPGRFPELANGTQHSPLSTSRWHFADWGERSPSLDPALGSGLER